MNVASGVSPETIRKNWCYYVQSKNQLAFSRLSKFPPGSESKIINALGLEKNDRILEIGSGLHILGTRLNSSDFPIQVFGCEPNENYLRASVPKTLRGPQKPHVIQGNGFQLPFPKNSFDRILSHAVATLFSNDDWKRLHKSIERVLTPEGTVIHMDNISNNSWVPPEIVRSTGEKKRYDKFKRMLKETHVELNTGYGHTAYDLPESLESIGGQRIKTDTYSWALDLNDPRWSNEQKKEMLRLWKQFDFDRIQRAERLWSELNQLSTARKQLLQKCRSDAERISKERFKALKNNRDIGWYSSTTLIVSASI